MLYDLQADCFDRNQHQTYTYKTIHLNEIFIEKIVDSHFYIVCNVLVESVRAQALAHLKKYIIYYEFIVETKENVRLMRILIIIHEIIHLYRAYPTLQVIDIQFVI